VIAAQRYGDGIWQGGSSAFALPNAIAGIRNGKRRVAHHILPIFIRMNECGGGFGW
jgi:hypothetical protein